jgi:anti-sigma B factor antagonist
MCEMSSKHGSHWLEREDFGAVTVVRLKAPKLLDDNTIREVFNPIYSLVADVGRSHLVLNLAGVEYLSSMALGKLVMLSRKAQAGNGAVALCHLSPTVENTLYTTHLKDLFTIYATEQEALQSFS